MASNPETRHGGDETPHARGDQRRCSDDFRSPAFGGWEPSERYPDPAIRSLDPSFNRYRLFNASIERLATGMRWCEGPVYFGDARCLIWSDIPNNRLMRYDEVSGAVSVYREPSNHANI